MPKIQVAYGELLYFYNTYWSYMGTARNGKRLAFFKSIRDADPTQPVAVDATEFQLVLEDTEAKLSVGDRYRYRKLYALVVKGWCDEGEQG